MSVFVIAECGVNHGGSLDTALRLIAAAKDAGADAAKFQAFTPWRLCPSNYERQAMLKGLALTREELVMCAAECRRLGIEFMCTPMDEEWLRVLLEIGVKRIKIGSGQVKDAEFVRVCADTGLPVLISNGMALGHEFARAVDDWLKDVADVTVMQCISEYPTSQEAVRMERLATLRDLYPTRKVGFSSHCPNFWPSTAAVYAGAVCVEQHLCLSRADSGPDMSSSLEPHEFKAMVREIRYAEAARK